MPSTRTKPGRSRLSSPTQLSSSPTGHNRGMATGSNGSRNFMQRWLEPPVQNKASYQEAGLVKGGVVENMAPLGTMPKAAMAKKPAQPGESADSPAGITGTPSAIKRIIIKKPSSSTPSETPPGSVAGGDRHLVLEKPVSSALGSLVSPSDTEITAVAEGDTPSLIADTLDEPMSPLSREPYMEIVMDDEEDDDYVPQDARPKLRHQSSQKKLASRVKGRRSLPARARLPRQTVEQQSRQPSPSPSPEIASSPVMAPISVLEHESQEKESVDKVVETAVQEALNHNRYPTAFALRRLYDDNAGDEHFTSMIEDIYHQRADISTVHEFKALVEKMKKDGAKGNKGFSYFLPGIDSPEKPMPAPYNDLIAKDVPNLEEVKDGQVTPCERASKKQRLDSNGRAAHRAAMETPSKSAGRKNGGKKASPTKGRRQRVGSVSSESSLSSVDDIPEDLDYNDYMDQVDDNLGVSRPSGGGAEPSNNAPTPASPSRPISTAHPQASKPAIEKKPAQPSPAATSSSSLTHHNKNARRSHNNANTQSHGSSMPGLVISDGASRSTNIKATVHPKKAAAAGGKLATLDPKVKELLERQRGTKAETNKLTNLATTESFTRDSLAADESALATPRASVPRSEPSRALLKTPALMGRTTRAAKRSHDEMEDVISPTSLSLRPELPEPPSTRGSRAATPSNLRSSTANKKARAGVRVKTSPVKKKGLSASMPRGLGDRLSPVGNAASGNKDENDDFCHTCSGSGELICCDGCRYSFHNMCIDPPITDDDLCRNDSWYCNECLVQRRGLSGERKGVFGSLLQNIESKNSRCFGLPTSVRDAFEGVKTGPDGEYEDVTAPAQKPKSNKRGVEEAFDFHRIRNPDETAALCHQCCRGSLDDRVLLPCSVCGLNWHLDCLDPPLAIPPPPRTWVCPIHVGDVPVGIIRKLAPAHKHRNLKNASIIEQAYSRGLKNNGNIIIEEDSDDDEVLIKDHVKDFGRTYRVPEKGIKLDFLAKVRREREERAKHGTVAATTESAAVPKPHTLEEQQVALNLSQLAQGDADSMGLLVNALMTEASPEIMSLMAAGDSGRIGGGDLLAQDTAALQATKMVMEKLVKNIGKILEGRGEPTSQDSVPTVATPASLVEKQAPGSDAGLNDNFALDDKGVGAQGPAEDAMHMD